jgi:hypothetical protein
VFHLLVEQIYEKKSTNTIFEKSYFKKSSEHYEIDIHFVVYQFYAGVSNPVFSK